MAAQQEILTRIETRVNEIHDRATKLRSVREQVKALTGRLPAGSDSVAAEGRRLIARIDSVEAILINPRSKTFQDVINFKNGLNDQYLNLGAAVNGTDAPVTQGMRERLADLERDWDAIRPRVDRILGAELDAFNATVRAMNVPAVSVK
jgi:hypothetical protein